MHLWSKDVHNSSTRSPSLSMIVTLDAALGPTCTPLEMRSSGMDRSSWKYSIVSITLSSWMLMVNVALVWPAAKSSWNCCDTKSAPPWEIYVYSSDQFIILFPNVGVHVIQGIMLQVHIDMYMCVIGRFCACTCIHACYIYLAHQQHCHLQYQQWLYMRNLLLEMHWLQPQKTQRPPLPNSQHFQWK